MKVIDLLNKIANGEAPKKIIIQRDELVYNEDLILNLQDCYYKSDAEDETWRIWAYNLNDEVEIIEEDKEEKKIPEKLDIYWELQQLIKDNNIDEHNLHKILTKIKIKQNEIIDYLDYLKSKGDE